MYPWLWLWAPRIQLPLSGTLSQMVEPNTSWFFGQIPSTAGDGALEKKIFDHASYGRQLGWITEVLLTLAGDGKVDPKSAGKSLARLKKNYLAVEKLKQVHRDESPDQLRSLLEKLRKSNPTEFANLLAEFSARAAAPALELDLDSI
jgi:hypothetical protein